MDQDERKFKSEFKIGQLKKRIPSQQRLAQSTSNIRGYCTLLTGLFAGAAALAPKGSTAETVFAGATLLSIVALSLSTEEEAMAAREYQETNHHIRSLAKGLDNMQ